MAATTIRSRLYALVDASQPGNASRVIELRTNTSSPAVLRICGFITLLGPVASLLIVTLTVANDTFYSNQCTLSVLGRLARHSSDQACSSVPLTSDWPSIAAASVSIVMFILYRRLSRLLAELEGQIRSRGDEFKLTGQPDPGDLLVPGPGFIERLHLTASEVPCVSRYSRPFRTRVWLLIAALGIANAVYFLAYIRGAWFKDLDGGSKNFRAYQDHWWAAWQTHPFAAACWIAMITGALYLGADNFWASTVLSLDLRQRIFVNSHKLPFIANLPSRRTVWRHLQNFVGEVQYGSFTALTSAALATVLVVEPDQDIATSSIAVADVLFAGLIWRRFATFKQSLYRANEETSNDFLADLERKVRLAQLAGRFEEAQFWLLELDRVARFGPLPTLPAGQIAVKIVVATVAGLSLIATVAQALH